MAEVAVTIRGTLYDLFNRTTQQVVLQGQASLTGLSVGGGPIYPEGGEPPSVWPGPGPLPHPEHPIAPGGKPPGIWGGPIDPYPGHPLPEPPKPGEKPPGIWGGPIDPYPGHPLPEPPIKPPDVPPSNPPSPQWEWGWHPEYGWHPVYVAGDKPSPPPVG